MNCFYAYVSPRQGAQVFAHFDTVFTGWQYINIHGFQLISFRFVGKKNKFSISISFGVSDRVPLTLCF